MLSQKWFELLQYLQDGTHKFVDQEEIVEQLSTKYNFLKSQFCNISKSEDPAQIDWLEHETFTSVIAEITKECSFTADEMDFIFNCLLSAKLAQLALALINNHKQALTEADFSFKRAIVLQRLGENDLAKQALEKTLELEPDHHLAIFHLGFISLYTGNLEQAKDYFSLCTEKAPEFVGGYQNLAGCYYQESEFEQAVECCKQAQQLEPMLAASYITAISSYLALGQLDAADEWLQKARDHQIEHLELTRLGGILAHQNGKHQEAVTELSRYLDVKHEDLGVLGIRAKALAADSQWQPLLADLEALLNLDPFDTWCLEQMFLASFHTGQWTQAEQAMFELCKQSDHYKIIYRSEIDEIRKQQAILLTATD